MPVAGLKVRSNVDQCLREIDDFVDAGKKLAASRALNTLQGQATVAGFRKIAEIYGVGPRTTEKYASVELAAPGNLQATITVKGRGYPLVAFNPIPTKRGVSVKIKGQRITFPGTFLAQMPNGHLGVFARGAYGSKSRRPLQQTGSIGRFTLGRGVRVKKANKWGNTELPINELFTFSPGDTFSNEDVTDAMMDRVDEQAGPVFERELAAVRRGF